MEAAEAAAGDMDAAEALEASVESAESAESRVKPGDWEAMTRNQRKNWATAQRRQRK